MFALPTLHTGMMENVMFLEPPEPPGAGMMESGNDGKRNVSEPPGAGMMENVTFLSRQARK